MSPELQDDRMTDLSIIEEANHRNIDIHDVSGGRPVKSDYRTVLSLIVQLILSSLERLLRCQALDP